MRHDIMKRLTVLEQRTLPTVPAVWIAPVDMDTGAQLGPAVRIPPGPLDYRRIVTVLAPTEGEGQTHEL